MPEMTTATLLALSDTVLITAYREWSEETFRAAFHVPDEETVRNFIAWLRGEWGQDAIETYEREMLQRFRGILNAGG